MTTTLFRDVRVFDGLADHLTGATSVLVEGSTIAAVGDCPDPEPGEKRTNIDGGGRVLMPGLIDAHVHLMFGLSVQATMLADIGFVHIASATGATEMLHRGFTSVRDAGGPVFGVKLAIDQGLVAGPRIWPSGALITQTSGHADFRSTRELPRGVCGHLTSTELVGAAAIADGVPEVLRAVRENLLRGASQIKVMAGGGVASPSDPLDVTQYTVDEMRAAVDAADDWGTYVMVHAYTPRAVQRAVEAGVRCIEHGQLLDEATVAMMGERGVWWSLQPFLADELANTHTSASSQAKQRQVAQGTDRAYELARVNGVRVAWGTDGLFDPRAIRQQNRQLSKMTRWFTPAEVLRMATSTNAELLQLSGSRSPYPGTLGVVQPGALADLLLVDGDPLADLTVLDRPETSLVVIMKDGAVCKNLLPPE